MTRAEIVAELARHNAAIDAAYWAFTRQARAKPPAVVVPEAYAERDRLEELLAIVDRPLRLYSSGAITQDMNATDTAVPHGFISKHVMCAADPKRFGDVGSEWSELNPDAFDGCVTFITEDQRELYKADRERVTSVAAKMKRDELLAFLLRHTWVCEADRRRVSDLRRLAVDLQMRMWWPVRRVA